MTQQPERLRGRLGAVAVAFMVLAAAAPLAGVAGVAPLGFHFGNGAGFPALFLVVGLTLVIFAVGYCAMAVREEESGGFFTYIRAALGICAGVGASFLATFAYVAQQVGMYPLIGLQISNFLATLGLSIPWWAIAIALVVIIGAVAYRNIEFSATALVAVMIIEILITLAITIAVLSQGGADGISLENYSATAIFSGNPALGLMLAMLCFLGFESTTIYRDEVKDARLTIPRATYLAVISIALFNSFVSWAFAQGWGDGLLAAAEESMAAGDMYQQTAIKFIGVWMGALVNVFLVTSLIACVLSYHNVTARYLFSNAQLGVLHSRLGTKHRRHNSPSVAAASLSVAILVILVVLILLQLDPYAQIYTWLTSVGVLGLVPLMIATSVAVIVYFAKNPQGVGLWTRLIAPAASGIALTALVVVIVANFGFLVGDVDADGQPYIGVTSAVILGATLLAPVLGLAWGSVVAKRGPVGRSAQVAEADAVIER